MTEEGAGAERVEGELAVTQELLESLAAKLDSFGEGLSDEERIVLGVIVTAGTKAMASEVEGFGAKDAMEIPSWSFGSPLSAPLGRYILTDAWPQKIEYSGLKAAASE